jgi:hypothetical protein
VSSQGTTARGRLPRDRLGRGRVLGLASRAEGADVPEPGHHQHGDSGQQHGADRGDHVQPAGEGLAGGAEQRSGELVGQALRRRARPTHSRRPARAPPST